MSAPASSLWEKLHELWQHLPLRGMGLLTAALPMGAVVFSASLAFVGNEQRERTEAALKHHIELVEGLGHLSALMLNAETGLRGYLLSQQAEFLAPYELAVQSLPGQMQSLHQLVESEPGERPRQEKRARLQGIHESIAREIGLFGELRQTGNHSGVGNAADKAQSLAGPLAESKATMDALREQLRAMRGAEQQLLSERLADIEHVRKRDYLTIAITLLLGLASRGVVFWMFNRRVVRRVRQLEENVRSLGKPGGLPNAPTEHRDDIGQLETSLAEAHARLKPIA